MLPVARLIGLVMLLIIWPSGQAQSLALHALRAAQAAWMRPSRPDAWLAAPVAEVAAALAPAGTV